MNTEKVPMIRNHGFKIDYVCIEADRAMPHSSGYHYHDTAEIMVIKTCNAKIFVDGKVIPIEGSCIVYFPAFVIHCCIATTECEYSRYCLTIEDAFLEENEQIFAKAFAIPVNLEMFDTVLAPTELLHKYFSSASGVFSPIDAKRRKHLLRWLVDEVVNVRCVCHEDVAGLKTYIAAVSEYLTVHFSETLLLSQIANEFFVSKSKLTSDFKKQCGVSIGDFITVLRIRHAKKQLRNTRRSISEIASDCGYGDAGYFIKQFTKLVGITPAKYRKKFKL